MRNFSVPNWVMKHQQFSNWKAIPISEIQTIKKKLLRFSQPNAMVSIVIPAYNEENNLLKTLSSLADTETQHAVELIVVNNNSTDSTAELLETLGVKTLHEKKQGISFARQCGLDNASGSYVLNADADSIYPPQWVNAHVAALQDQSISCVYGRYSFIPGSRYKRWQLALYEFFAVTIFNVRSSKKDYLNVMGFNFSFRKEDGIAVGGFNTKRLVWEDGWMGMQLLERGKIYCIKNDTSRVWTSDRRLMDDGSLWRAFHRRIIDQSSRIFGYFFPKSLEKNE
ncbi:MAG: glycosyltransferase family 2 protein [Chitinophagales bacterium]|nr:glycosyltransferase family 2 protein [Bacteroidota bacterium]MCB9042539.1 glycosyltransferase family 2 protein [Chitinophagales bacterium]